MIKPANVAYVYPLSGGPRQELEVPEYLEMMDGLVIFNVEAGRADDLMSKNDQLVSLRLLIGDCLSKGLGLVVLAPERAAS